MSVENDDQLVERLVPKILASIRAKARAVESIPIKADLDGITSLPAYDTTGEQFKQVLVPIDALKEPALSAGEEAKDAALKAEQAFEESKEVTANAVNAADRANEAADLASEFANKIIVQTEDEYNQLVENETVDATKLYFLYEGES